MPMYPNMPGIQVRTNDGGLTTSKRPTAKKILIIGTSEDGPADVPYGPVTDRAKTGYLFGRPGTLVKAMEEAMAYSDNVYLYRIGTSPATLGPIGRTYAAQVAVTNVARAADGTVTLTAAAHGLVAGDWVLVSGLTNDTNSFNGLFQVTATTGTTYSYMQVGKATVASIASTGGGGGKKVTNLGYSVTLGVRSADITTRYKVYHKNGALYIWLDGNLVYAYDVTNSFYADTADCNVTGATTAGNELSVNTGVGATYTNALDLTAVQAVVAGASGEVVSFVAAVTGLNLTGRQTYVALAKALDLLETFECNEVVCPNVVFDNPNVAFYVASDPLTVNHNPVTNTSALDWLKVTVDAYGNKVYQWASETTDSAGNTVTAFDSGTNNTPAKRVTAGFHEVDFGYLLADFASKKSELLGGCFAIMGTSGPAKNKFDLASTKTWLGYLPTYDATGKPTAAGAGLLGLPALVGTVASKLNPLATGGNAAPRYAGFFRTDTGFYDGAAQLDDNGNPVDIGAYLHVFADFGALTNGYGRRYLGNCATLIAGFLSVLDEKSGLTRKRIGGVERIAGWRPGFSQMDAATVAKINLFVGDEDTPVVLHDMTCATANSDYITLFYLRLKLMMTQLIFDLGKPFIGEGSLDGLTLTAMKTKFDAAAAERQKRGYISYADFQVRASLTERRLGHAEVDITFSPADQLRQLRAAVAIARR